MGGTRIVIAAPLYNGGPHVAPALRSLLAQTHDAFRLLLLDDASTDGTADVARALAAADPRVELHVNPRRVGMLENTRRAWQLARERHPEAELWALASDHDLWDARWLETLVGLLDADPTAVLAYPLTRRIDADGRPIADRPRPWRCQTVGISDPRDRVRRAYRCMVAGDMIYGLFRVSALDAVGPYRRVLVPDRLLLSELALRGTFVQAEEVLWSRRFAGLAELDRQRRAFFLGGAPPHTRLPWWLAHAGAAAGAYVLWPAPGLTRREGAAFAALLLRESVRLRVVRRLQRRRRRLGARLERPVRALLRRPRPRALVARRSLPVPSDTQVVLERLAREAAGRRAVRPPLAREEPRP
jgi:GT2 family glycosyltransferase